MGNWVYGGQEKYFVWEERFKVFKLGEGEGAHVDILTDNTKVAGYEFKNGRWHRVSLDQMVWCGGLDFTEPLQKLYPNG